MIRGIVTNELDAWIDLAVANADQPSIGFSAIVDTGFSGFLTLPESVLVRFQAKPMFQMNVELGDGSEIIADLYQLTIHWDGRSRRIEVEAAETVPLVGMSLLRGYDLQMQIVPEGEVMIREISSA